MERWSQTLMAIHRILQRRINPPMNGDCKRHGGQGRCRDTGRPWLCFSSAAAFFGRLRTLFSLSGFPIWPSTFARLLLRLGPCYCCRCCCLRWRPIYQRKGDWLRGKWSARRLCKRRRESRIFHIGCVSPWEGNCADPSRSAIGA